METQSKYSTGISWAGKLIVILYCLALPPKFLLAQTIGLVAKYPMEAEGDKIMRLYDVSGNGNHGKILNLSNRKLENIYGGFRFYNGNVLKKQTGDNSYITIPDIYKNSDIFNDGFSVTFWLYIDSREQPSPVTTNLINLPQFTITKSQEEANATRLKLQFASYQNGQVSIEIPEKFGGQGWYYFYIGYGGTRHKNVIEYGYYYDNGWGNYDPSVNAITEHTIVNQYAIAKYYPNSTPTLLDSKFIGAISNISFFDYFLDDIPDLNEDRNTSYYIAMENADKVPFGFNHILLYPQSYYPCSVDPSDPNDVQILDLIGNRNAKSATGCSYTSDRFGNAKGAVKFNGDGQVLLPNFFEDCNGCKSKAIDPVKGYTLSFWTYIDQNLFPPDDTVFPFEDQDDTQQFIFINSRDGNRGGISLRRDRLIVDRYIQKNPVTTWQMWMWDPVSFQNSKGWNHVIFCQKENAVRVYIYKPDGSLNTTLNYFNSQAFNPNDGLTFGFGKPQYFDISNVRAATTIDDVRVYSWPFSNAEAAILHQWELMRTLGKGVRKAPVKKKVIRNHPKKRSKK